MITNENFEDFEQDWELISSDSEEELELSDAEREEISVLFQEIIERRKSATCPFIYAISVPIEMSDETKMTGQLKIAILKEWIAKHDLGLIDDFLKLELEDIRELLKRDRPTSPFRT